MLSISALWQARCERPLPNHAFLALATDETSVGVLTLNACTAHYVADTLGWIQEFSVVPVLRSTQVGWALATAHHWQRLEVNTPASSAWPRTVAVFRRERFYGASAHLRLAL
ncbi:MAG: hypothetical protein H0X24_23700 [Ktedonobacterales bacterium]|nr:hypothetical protein [Ktedonobacterales bacterium]